MRGSLAVALVLAITLTTSAWAQGKRPPTPTSLPTALLALHDRQSNCEPIANLVHGEDWEIHRLGDDEILFMVPCFARAYNFSHQLYTSREGADYFTRLLFADYSDSHGRTGTDQLVGAFFDPDTLTLSSFYKGRGLADCGTSGI